MSFFLNGVFCVGTCSSVFFFACTDSECADALILMFFWLAMKNPFVAVNFDQD